MAQIRFFFPVDHNLKKGASDNTPLLSNKVTFYSLFKQTLSTMRFNSDAAIQSQPLLIGIFSLLVSLTLLPQPSILHLTQLSDG